MFEFLRRTPPPAIREVVLAFESLGDNCEFGLVQRYVGAEPLGLFRFSATVLDAVVAALDEDFRHYGAGDDLFLQTDGAAAYVCVSRHYQFAYATGVPVAGTDPGALLRRETAKVAYLKRRLLEDLAGGEKILVRKAMPEDRIEDLRRLSRAVRRHGRCRLLWVREAGSASPGPPRLHDATLIEDSIPVFAPVERAYALDLESWAALCRRVHGLTRAVAPANGPPHRQRNLLARAVRGPVPHVVSQPETIAGTTRRVGHLDASCIYTYSAWVWLPAEFAGRRVGATIGHHRLAARDADLARRECWQRVWVSARWPERPAFLDMGLVVSAENGGRFWSAHERLEEGPLPGPASPPRSPPA